MFFVLLFIYFLLQIGQTLFGRQRDCLGAVVPHWWPYLLTQQDGVAGVVVSCKIPILATRVRFPGDACSFWYVLISSGTTV